MTVTQTAVITVVAIMAFLGATTLTFAQSSAATKLISPIPESMMVTNK